MNLFSSVKPMPRLVRGYTGMGLIEFILAKHWLRSRYAVKPDRGRH